MSNHSDGHNRDTGNPYRSPLEFESNNSIGIRTLFFKFRTHVALSPIVGILLAGNPHKVSNPMEAIIGVPTMAYLMRWGIWVPPLNALLVIAVLTLIIVMQIRKSKGIGNRFKATVAQIVLWWGIWLLFGAAERFGEYVGP